MKKEELLKLLKHEDNQLVNILYVKEKNDLGHFLNIYYCCNDGVKYGIKREDAEKALLKLVSFKTKAVLLKLLCSNLEEFRALFKREMHLINQLYRRKLRFEDITTLMYDKLLITTKNINIDDFINKNFSKLEKLLPVKSERFNLEKLSEQEVLLKLSTGEITLNLATNLLNTIKYKEEEERDRKQNLCSFKDPDGRKNHPCTHPAGNTKCGSCRVAADWEEAYG